MGSGVNLFLVILLSHVIGGKCIIFDKWQTPRWDETRQLIRVAVLTQGVKDVYIDPLTNFSVGMSGGGGTSGHARQLSSDKLDI